MKFKETLTSRHIAEQNILKKYPKIFKQASGKVTETCMCWGLDCGEGWYYLIDALCNQLQFDIDNNKEPQLEATQVKEKFGKLRFYTDGTTDRQEAMIDLAELFSSYVCERCGTTANVNQNESGWIKTLCNKCRKKIK